METPGSREEVAKRTAGTGKGNGSGEAGWEVAAPVLESAGVRPAEGYPKLLESRKVAGLKPGFWVWVVGFCTGEESTQVLSQLKEVYPGAYARG